MRSEATNERMVHDTFQFASLMKDRHKWEKSVSLQKFSLNPIIYFVWYIVGKKHVSRKRNFSHVNAVSFFFFPPRSCKIWINIKLAGKNNSYIYVNERREKITSYIYVNENRLRILKLDVFIKLRKKLHNNFFLGVNLMDFLKLIFPVVILFDCSCI